MWFPRKQGLRRGLSTWGKSSLTPQCLACHTWPPSHLRTSEGPGSTRLRHICKDQRFFLESQYHTAVTSEDPGARPLELECNSATSFPRCACVLIHNVWMIIALPQRTFERILERMICVSVGSTSNSSTCHLINVLRYLITNGSVWWINTSSDTLSGAPTGPSHTLETAALERHNPIQCSAVTDICPYQCCPIRQPLTTCGHWALSCG